MRFPPAITLSYEPVRIGWVIGDKSLASLRNAASQSVCLWGGVYNPIIPAHDTAVANQLIRSFGVNILVPVDKSEKTKALIASHPDLKGSGFCEEKVFNDHRCNYADVRHPMFRIDKWHQHPMFSLPSWETDDPLASYFSVAFGIFATGEEIPVDYSGSLKSRFSCQEIRIKKSEPVPPGIRKTEYPIRLSSQELDFEGHNADEGLILLHGSVSSFEDLALFWNLRAARVQVRFHDPAQSFRLLPLLIDHLKESGFSGVIVYTRSGKPDLNGLPKRRYLVHPFVDSDWANIRPPRPSFPISPKSVIPTLREDENRLSVSFVLAEAPLEDRSPGVKFQQYLTVVHLSDSHTHPDEPTFRILYAPCLSGFYGQKMRFGESAYSLWGPYGGGKLGVLTKAHDQTLQLHAIPIQEIFGTIFRKMEITIERSHPGLLCNRLIRQLGGIQGCRVLKLRGVRELIRGHAHDESFTRSKAFETIIDKNPETKKPNFDQYKNLFLESAQEGNLTNGKTFNFLLKHRMLRVGLELKCPSCELSSWLSLDEARAEIICPFCGAPFNAALQLRDRDWRYRRSGLFGDKGDQQGSVPVALTIQQLHTHLYSYYPLFSTALKFRGKFIPPCEVDLVCAINPPGFARNPLQIILAEVKGHHPIEEDDVRNLCYVADAFDRNIAEPYLLFSKLSPFSSDELSLLKKIRGQYNVILFSERELNPYHLYEGQHYHGSGPFAQMVSATGQLYFR